jgi:hypothetical protein
MPDQLQPASQFILYQDDNSITNINVRFDSKDRIGEYLSALANNGIDKILCHYIDY